MFSRLVFLKRLKNQIKELSRLANSDSISEQITTLLDHPIQKVYDNLDVIADNETINNLISNTYLIGEAEAFDNTDARQLLSDIAKDLCEFSNLQKDSSPPASPTASAIGFFNFQPPQSEEKGDSPPRLGLTINTSI